MVNLFFSSAESLAIPERLLDEQVATLPRKEATEKEAAGHYFLQKTDGDYRKLYTFAP